MEDSRVPNLEIAFAVMAGQLRIVIENMNCLTTAATLLTLPHMETWRTSGDTPTSKPPTKAWRPKPAAPADFDGDQKRGLTFLHSCQTYIHLCPEEFWAMSYMKSGCAAKWAARISAGKSSLKLQWKQNHWLEWFLRGIQKGIHPCTCRFTSDKLPQICCILLKGLILRQVPGRISRPHHGFWLHRPEDHCGEIPERSQPTNSEFCHNYGYWKTLWYQPWSVVWDGLHSGPEQSHKWSLPLCL